MIQSSAMKRKIIAKCRVIVCGAIIATALSVVYGGVNIRPITDTIRWQTYLPADADKPVSWRWEGAADCAYLTVTGHIERIVTGPLKIVRSAGAKYGSYNLGPLVSGSKETRLYDMVLELRNGEETIERQFARVAVLPTALELKKAPPSRTWRQTDRSVVHIVPYSSEWTNATLSAGSASLTMTSQDGVENSVALEGVSGFAPLDVVSMMSGDEKQFDVILDFDDTPVWHASLTAKCALVFVIK